MVLLLEILLRMTETRNRGAWPNAVHRGHGGSTSFNTANNHDVWQFDSRTPHHIKTAKTTLQKPTMHSQPTTAAFFLSTFLATAKPEMPLTPQDFISSYISDFRAFEPDLGACFKALDSADGNGDGIIQEHEYPSLMLDLSQGKISHVAYDNLPLATKLNFMYLSCLCDEGMNCCKGICKWRISELSTGIDLTIYLSLPQAKKRASSPVEQGLRKFALIPK